MTTLSDFSTTFVFAHHLQGMSRVVRYAPVNVTPHLPQAGQRVGICRGLSDRICPQGRGICNKALGLLTSLQCSETDFESYQQ